MVKRILLVGHCGPDSFMLKSAVKYAVAGAELAFANDDEALSRELAGDAQLLLLVNRVLDGGFVELGGAELIKTLRQSHPQVKTMMISNYPDAQAAAVAAGALPGFGKGEAGSKKMRDVLSAAFADEIAAGR